jgi:hypothetical protein
MSAEKITLTGFTQHVALYAKRHYVQSDNTIEDLRSIIAHISGVHRRHVTLEDVYQVVADAFIFFSEMEPRSRTNDFIRNLFHNNQIRTGKSEISLEWLIGYLLSFITHVEVSGRKDGKIIDIGRPKDHLLLRAFR